MGIPRFFRWIGERYPCLSQVVKQYQIPDFDNLYLDVNGIIHTCSHPDDDNPHFRITEEKIFGDICRYIEFLFTMIKPQKVFFIAVDGVAPRAKMNQQRGRRFKSAKAAAEQEVAAQRRGEKLPDTDRFDSNCITPGTEFMARLDNVLNHFIQYKVSTDPNWQSVTVYYSSHSVPGEGEHKIMDFLRYQRSLPTYDPETRHCLYGLDTDLIMLGLVTHEPYFSLLREEILFKKTAKRPTCPEQTTFFLLHLRLFREYLEFEFRDLPYANMKFAFDLERLIDDWVLIEFLIGNDFIPHVPDCHVVSNDLPQLWGIYKEILPTLDGYLNENGRLNLARFQVFIKALAEFDRRKFESRFDDIKYMAAKTGGRPKKPVVNELDSDDDNDGFQLVSSNEKKLMRQLMPFYNAEDNLFGDGEDGDSELMPDMSSEDDEGDADGDEEAIAFRAHKRDYYRSKMQLSGEKPMRTAEFVRLQVDAYIEAIEWTLRYYYEGVPSWGWFYPFHYAPYLSDMHNISNMKLTFKPGTPFHPFEQLMSVLPSASRKLLPSAYRSLMTDASSSIRHFYPEDFATDLNGKQLDWEAVVLIPFIEENQLLGAIRPLERTLTPAEIDRNSFGTINAFRYKGEQTGTVVQSSLSFIPKYKNCSFKDCIPWDKFHLKPNEVCRKYPLEALSSLKYIPNFPTFKHLPCEVSKYAAGTNVFKMPSRNENTIVKVSDSVKPTLEAIDAVASTQVGQIVLVNWPFLTEARVISIYTPVKYYTTEETDYSAAVLPVVESAHTPDSIGVYQGDMRFVNRHYYTTHGLDFRNSKCIVYAAMLVGIKYAENDNNELTAVKLWSSTPQPYPYEGIIFNLKNVAAENSLLAAPPVHVMTTKLGELFPLGDTIFVISENYFGRMGIVIGYDERRNSVKARVRLSKQPNFDDLIRRLQSGTAGVVYNNGHNVGRLANCTSYFLSRLTGYVRVKEQPKPGDNGEIVRVNIGLDLKHSRDNLRVPGYTYRDEQGTWLYSDQVADLIQAYRAKFPFMLERLQDLIQSNVPDPFNYKDLFPEARVGSNEELAKVREFLTSLPTARMTPVPNDSFILEEQLVNDVDRCINKGGHPTNFIEVFLKPDALYRPRLSNRVNLPSEIFGNGNGANFNLLDRVINIAASHSVPLGLEGTIIGVLEEATSTNAYEEKPRSGPAKKVTYEVLFDQEFQHGAVLRCPEKRGYRMFPQNLLGVRRMAPRQRQQRPNQAVQQRQPQKPREATKNYAQALTGQTDPSAMWKAMGGTESERPKAVGSENDKTKNNAGAWPLVPGNLVKSEGKKAQRQHQRQPDDKAIPIPPRLLLNKPIEQGAGPQAASLTSILKDIGVPEVVAPTVAAANKSANGRPAVPVFGSPSSAVVAKSKTTSSNGGDRSKSSQPASKAKNDLEWEPKNLHPHDWDHILSGKGIKVSAISAPGTSSASPRKEAAKASTTPKVPLRERQSGSAVSAQHLMKMFNGTPVTPVQNTGTAYFETSSGGEETNTAMSPRAAARKTPSKHAPQMHVDEAKIKLLQRDFAQLRTGKPIEFAPIQDSSASSSADSTPLQLSPSKNPQRIDASQLIASVGQTTKHQQQHQPRTDYVEKLSAWAKEHELMVRYEVHQVGKDAVGKSRFSSRIVFAPSSRQNVPVPRAFEASFVANNESEARRSAAKTVLTQLEAHWNKGNSSLLQQQQHRQRSPRREYNSPRKGTSNPQASSNMFPVQVLKNMSSNHSGRGNNSNASLGTTSQASVPMLGGAAPPPSALPIPGGHIGGFFPAPSEVSDHDGSALLSPSSMVKPLDLNTLLNKPNSTSTQPAATASAPSVALGETQVPLTSLLPPNSLAPTSNVAPTPASVPVPDPAPVQPPATAPAKRESPPAKPKPRLAACFGAPKQGSVSSN